MKQVLDNGFGMACGDFFLGLVSCIGMIWTFTLPVVAQEAAPDNKSLEAENAQKRLDFMNKAMARNELAILGKTEIPSKLIPAPLLRWSSVEGNVKDGGLYGFTRGGRLDVVMQFPLHSETFTVQEFVATCEQPISMKRDGQEFWRYDSPSIEWNVLPDAKPPHESKTARTVQFRQLAESFEIQIDHGQKTFVRQPLRLLRQPVHRYQDLDIGAVDGAVFAFVLETDPEAILMLEACQSDTGPQWRYAVTEMTVNALEVTRNGKKVWEKPDHRVFCQSFVKHYTCPYRPLPDDVSLKGTLKMSTAVPAAAGPTPTPARAK